MKRAEWLGAVLLVAAADAARGEERAMLRLNKITPILIVEAIEPALPFWVERLGFEKVAEVAAGERLGFVMLQGHGAELMLQTRANLEAEVDEQSLPGAMRQTAGGGVLYLDVDDLDALRQRVQGFDVLVPHRRTFYGADELWLREPGGNLIGFAHHAPE